MMNQDACEALQLCAERMSIEFGRETGPKIMRVVYEQLGGLRMTIPTIEDIERHHRNVKIRNQFTGFNHRELAERWGMSVRQIRRVVNR